MVCHDKPSKTTRYSAFNKNGSRKSPGIHYNLLVSDEMSAIFYQSATPVNGLEKGLIADTTTTQQWQKEHLLPEY